MVWGRKKKKKKKKKKNQEYPNGIIQYHQTLLVSCHIMGIPDQDVATLYNSLFHSQLSSNKVLLQWCKIWINW